MRYAVFLACKASSSPWLLKTSFLVAAIPPARFYPSSFSGGSDFGAMSDVCPLILPRTIRGPVPFFDGAGCDHGDVDDKQF